MDDLSFFYLVSVRVMCEFFFNYSAPGPPPANFAEEISIHANPTRNYAISLPDRDCAEMTR
jgi:hypothetical protein